MKEEGKLLNDPAYFLKEVMRLCSRNCCQSEFSEHGFFGYDLYDGYDYFFYLYDADSVIEFMQEKIENDPPRSRVEILIDALGITLKVDENGVPLIMPCAIDADVRCTGGYCVECAKKYWEGDGE